MTVSLSTDCVGAEDRAAWFREDVSARFGIGTVCPADGDAFNAEMTLTSLGDAQLLEIAASPLSIERNLRDVSSADPNLVVFGLVLEGQGRLEQLGRTATLAAGDLVLCVSRHPLKLSFTSAFRQLLFYAPRSQLDARLCDLEKIAAVRIGCAEGVAALTSDFLRSLSARGPTLAGLHPAISAHALDLLALTHGATQPAAPLSGKQHTLDRIHAFIDANLANPALGPDVVAKHLRISRRYLYKLLSERGESLGDRIRKGRLERCKQLLADPDELHRHVSEIAFANGFSDPSHFSRVFKDAYGMTPREFRRQVEATLPTRR